MTPEKYLFALADNLRGSIPSDEYVSELALLLIWQQSQQRGGIPSFGDMLNGNISLKQVYLELAKEFPALDHWFNASVLVKMMGSTQIELLVQLLKQAPELSAAAWLDAIWQMEIQAASKKHDLLMLPKELTELMLELAFLKGDDKQTVYAPFTASTALASIAAQKTEHVVLEQPQIHPLIFLMSLFTGFECIFSNPLTEPTQVSEEEQGNELKQFTHVIMAPPFGLKTGSPIIDRYNRFGIERANGDVMALQHALAQCSGRLVSLCSLGLLFRGGSDQELRYSLLKNGWLDSVIELPAGLLTNTGIPTSILIVDKKRDPNSPVFFYDAGMDGLVEKPEIRSLRPRLKHWQAIVEAIESRAKSNFGQLVSREEILANDANLSVRRYVLDPSANYIQNQSNTRPLSEVTSMIRAQIFKESTSASATTFREVGLRDIAPSGKITPPDKVIRLSGGAQEKAQQQRLLPGDILLSIKGNVGQVGLMTAETTENWIAGQTFMVLRPNRIYLQSEYLYRYLASPAVQQYLVLRSGGSSIPILKADDLNSLPVPILPQEEQQRVLETHREIIKEYGRIRELEEHIEQLKCQHWSLN